MPQVNSADVIRFWFEEIEPKDHWRKSAAFDKTVRNRFADTLIAASVGELDSWRASPLGRLAEILVLDQFSRNMYRDSARAFATDPLALVLAQEAVRQGIDKQLNPLQRTFLYMPYMHSESLLIHEYALALFTANDIEESLEFERRHIVIIEKFGRYPHRNELLGRASTTEELAFLQQPGSGF